MSGAPETGKRTMRRNGSPLTGIQHGQPQVTVAQEEVGKRLIVQEFGFALSIDKRNGPFVVLKNGVPDEVEDVVGRFAQLLCDVADSRFTQYVQLNLSSLWRRGRKLLPRQAAAVLSVP